MSQIYLIIVHYRYIYDTTRESQKSIISNDLRKPHKLHNFNYTWQIQSLKRQICPRLETTTLFLSHFHYCNLITVKSNTYGMLLWKWVHKWMPSCCRWNLQWQSLSKDWHWPIMSPNSIKDPGSNNEQSGRNNHPIIRETVPSSKGEKCIMTEINISVSGPTGNAVLSYTPLFQQQPLEH